MVVKESQTKEAPSGADGNTTLAPNVKKVKAMLRAVLKHKPFATTAIASELEAWSRVRDDVWKGATPAFDVQAVFALLMAHPSSSQREFQGWDTVMYQLRTRLMRKCARFNAAQSDPSEPGTPPLPGSLSEGDDEPYPKRLRIRRSALESQEEEENAWIGEIDGTADPVSDFKLVRAIVEMKPHAALTAGDIAMAWHRVITWLRERGYSRTLTVKALKRQFGVLLRVLSEQNDGDDRNTELRAMLLNYCESVEHLSPAMARFFRQYTDTSLEQQAEICQLSTRARRAAPARPSPPPKETPGTKARGAKPTNPRPTRRSVPAQEAPTRAVPVADEPASVRDEAFKTKLLEALEVRARLYSEETRLLMSYLGKRVHERASTSDVEG